MAVDVHPHFSRQAGQVVGIVSRQGCEKHAPLGVCGIVVRHTDPAVGDSFADRGKGRPIERSSINRLTQILARVPTLLGEVMRRVHRHLGHMIFARAPGWDRHRCERGVFVQRPPILGRHSLCREHVRQDNIEQFLSRGRWSAAVLIIARSGHRTPRVISFVDSRCGLSAGPVVGLSLLDWARWKCCYPISRVVAHGLVAGSLTAVRDVNEGGLPAKTAACRRVIISHPCCRNPSRAPGAPWCS